MREIYPAVFEVHKEISSSSSSSSSRRHWVLDPAQKSLVVKLMCQCFRVRYK